jgi:site-specific DNA-methyltransferase (adenine-specific)
MTIENKITNVPTIAWETIKTWEFNQLKDNSSRNVTKLKNSILKNGFIAPFDCWKSKEDKHFVIDGTGRNLAFLQLETEGYDIPALPVVFIDAKNIKEAKKFALQRSSTHGEITQSSLADFTIDFDPVELQDLALEEISLAELDLIIAKKTTIQQNINKQELENIKILECVKPNDCFEIITKYSTFKIGCLDATNLDQLTNFLDKKIDLVLTDAPYGVSITKPSKGSSVNNGKFIEINGDSNTNVAKKFYKNCKALKIDNIILWGGNYFTDFLPPTRCWLIWDKEVPKGMSFARGEMAWTNFDKNMEIYTQRWSGAGITKEVTDYNGMSRSTSESGSFPLRVHPTQKPVEMQIEIIQDLIPECKTIFDAFLGSGTMLLVAHYLKKDIYATEIIPHYAQVSIIRLINFLQKENIDFKFNHINGNLKIEDICQQ